MTPSGGGDELQIDEAFDAAAESGTIAEAIVVGIDAATPTVAESIQGTKPRTQEMTPTPDENNTKGSGKGPKLLALVTDELKPKVDAEFRTKPDRASTFIGGFSLGGLMSVYAGIERGDVFGGIIGMSSSAWWNDKMIVGRVRESKPGPTHPIRVYVDVGDAETSPSIPHIEANMEMFQAYKDAGYVEGSTLKTLVEPGAEHVQLAWRKRAPAALAFVVGSGR